MVSDMQSCSVTERLRQILKEHGDCITPCLVSMLIYGVENLDDGLEPCCEHCIEYSSITIDSDAWCSDMFVIVDCLV